MDPIEEKLKLLKPLLGPRQWGFLRMQYLFEKDMRKRMEAERMIDLLIAKNIPGLKADQVLLPPPEADVLSGDYPIGDAIYAGKAHGMLGVREGEWIRHCGIFGKTGSGKTTLAFRILREFCRKGKPFLIFDYKRNYRDILKHPDFRDEEILVFTVGRKVVPFQFNPKRGPPGVEEYVWTKQLAQIIEKVYLLGPGANDVFMESADMGTFEEMKNRVLKQRKKARELLWWASVKRTLNAITYPGLGEVVNCESGYSIPDLLRRKVILELDGLSNSDQGFIIGTLLLWIYHYRMREPEREILKHFILIEEAHHLFLKSRTEEDIADILMREIRELGEAIIIIDQHPSKMSVSALGNLSTKFALSMSLNQDVMALANAMLLEKDQKRYLAMLTVGETVCRSDRFPMPVLLSIPNFALQKGLMTDEDLKMHMERYLKDLGPENPEYPQSGTVRGIQKRETLSPLGRILLENIALKPLLGVVTRFKKLGIKTSDGYRVVEELRNLKLIVPLTVDGKRLFDVTREGKSVLGDRVRLRGRGGLEHRYFVDAIRNHYDAAGAEVSIEKSDIDIVVKRGTKTLAVQIETGKSDLQASLTKLGRFEAGFKFVVATNPETAIRLEETLKGYFIPDRENIRVVHVKDFLKDPPALP